jgi:hypothetical protein
MKRRTKRWPTGMRCAVCDGEHRHSNKASAIVANEGGMFTHDDGWRSLPDHAVAHRACVKGDV